MSMEKYMSSVKLDHIGIAVESLESALKIYQEGLGLCPDHIEEMPERGIKVAFLRLGDTTLELIQSIKEGSNIAKFIASRGQGLHHLCFEVPAIEAAIETGQRAGMKPLSEKPEKGAHQTLVSFFHPKTTAGVLMEFCQKIPG